MIAPPGLVLLLSCILVILRLSTAQQCSYAANFTSNSTYAINRNILLSSLASNATANGGFFAATLGQNSTLGDTVYAMALCRGDISNSSCFDCVNSSTHAIMTNCPNQKGATDFSGPNSNYCTVRCYDNSFFGVADALPALYVWLPMNFTGNGSEFDQALNDLVVSLVNRAAVGGSRLKFATGETTYSKFYPLYALVQCVPDLSPEDCGTCLWGAVADYQSCCARNPAVYIMRASCTFQYSLTPFIQPTVGAPPPPAFHTAPPSQPTSNTASREGKGRISSHVLIAIVVPLVVFVLVLVTGFCFLRRKAKKKYYSLQEDTMANEIKRAESVQFDLITIKSVTKNFSEDCKIREDGFCVVYKGTLPNGQEIAVKRLSRNSGQGAEEFKNEAVLVAKLQHRNLVRVLGFCLEGEEQILVYEFVPNKSLDYFLFDAEKQEKLDWSRRYKIIIGIARGLFYLHEDSRLGIIRCDLKTSNILLDGDMNAKISEFGIARIFGSDQTQGNTSKVVGTYGYMSPEYAMHGQFSVKSDVYSFGVLVLEIISGKKNSNFYQSEFGENLTSYAWKVWRDGTPLELIDGVLQEGTYSGDEVKRCIHIGLLCLQEDPEARPSMASVIVMLNGHFVTLSVPQQLAFFARRRASFHTPIEVLESG